MKSTVFHRFTLAAILMLLVAASLGCSRPDQINGVTNECTTGDETGIKAPEARVLADRALRSADVVREFEAQAMSIETNNRKGRPEYWRAALLASGDKSVELTIIDVEADVASVVRFDAPRETGGPGGGLRAVSCQTSVIAREVAWSYCDAALALARSSGVETGSLDGAAGVSVWDGGLSQGVSVVDMYASYRDDMAMRAVWWVGVDASNVSYGEHLPRTIIARRALAALIRDLQACSASVTEDVRHAIDAVPRFVGRPESDDDRWPTAGHAVVFEHAMELLGATGTVEVTSYLGDLHAALRAYRSSKHESMSLNSYSDLVESATNRIVARERARGAALPK